MTRLKGIFFHWLPLGVTIIGVAGLIYLPLQQAYRAGLDDPQIQMVDEAVQMLSIGRVPAEVVPRIIFRADVLLTPFIAIYDKAGTPLEADATIDNAPPKPPMGVFDYALAHGEDRVTWQPTSGTRIALVVKPVPNNSGWFVAAGRNMKEIEMRETRLTGMIGVGTLVLLIVSFLADAWSDEMRRRIMKN